MTTTPTAANGHTSPRNSSIPSSFTKFNSALTAGLLNPMSPPPPPPAMHDKSRASPTLFEMMSSEAGSPVQIHNLVLPSSSSSRTTTNHLVISAQDKQALAMQRISNLLVTRSPGNQFNDPASSDVKLTLSSKDGISITMCVHRQILVAHSRFFATKLSDRWSSSPYIVEISDCDDVEVYIETLMLMYCRDSRKKMMRQDVSRVLGILKVSAPIGFDAGVLSCLEYLEAAPWSEDEEHRIASLLSELHLENVGATEVLRRVSVEATHNGSSNDEVLLNLLHIVLEGKDEKARRDMKTLVSKMLRENSSGNDLRKESLYLACDGCLHKLKRQFLQAAESDLRV
ncbi:unnamed protein product [Eruca vesicaria subsp. sativa]|uniref:BTB domain-containing protein n=1 Tax=Eruca vesicaria subsp. sativa TaxID=29727 RepID=A0ABC8K0N5_ERUVS|nr:unnamed protein product [Eruca vesicaria subsp. sativa]